MKNFIKILKPDLLFFLITSLVILSLNLTPLILQARHAPSDRTFTLVHNNIQDFYFYQALMNQGANGAWLISDPYTTEPHQTSIIFAYFTWLGKLSKLLNFPYSITYHLVRTLTGFLLLFIVFRFLLTLKIPYPKLTFFFFVFASPLMQSNVPFMNWWTGMDAIRRAAYLPHHMIGALLLVISIILILQYFNTRTRKHLIYLIVVAPIMGFVHTPSLFILLLILPPTILIYVFSKMVTVTKPVSFFGNVIRNLLPKRASLPTNSKQFGALAIYWAIGLFSLILMVSQTQKGFPWSQYLTWEKNLQFPLDKELIGAMGILFPFGLIGGIFSLFSKRFDRILITCWLIVPFLLIPFAQRLNISNIRLIQGVPYLPLAILATLGISTIQKGLQAILINVSNKFQKFIGLLGYWVIGLFLIIFFIFTLPTMSWSLKDQIREYWTIYSNVYLDKNLFIAFTFINDNYPDKIKTLSTFYTGNYLPAYTNSVSFIGHFGYTYKVEEKEKQVKKFFENKMASDEAKQFILSNNIDLVFQGPEEKPMYKDHLYPEVLKPNYDREEVTLYTLK